MPTSTKFSRVERLLLANQYRILEMLYPKEASTCQRLRTVLEEGYEYEYEQVIDHIQADIMSHSECLEALTILRLHRAMKFSYDELKDKTGLKEADIAFHGFDANDAKECKYLAYVRYIREQRNYEELHEGDGFNSHWPMLSRYREMLRLWDGMGKRNELTKEDLARLGSVKEVG